MKILTIALFAVVAAGSFAQGCCAGDKGLQAFDAKDKEFLALAASMKSKADRGAKPVMCDENPGIAKGAEGCCNAQGEPAKFKVFVKDVGYKFFGCQETAKEGRLELIAANKKVGKVQPVSGAVKI